MRRAKGLALAGLAFAAIGVALPAAAADDGLAIVGATLIDGTGKPPVRDAVVVVAGERIKAAGPRATTPIPKGVTIVDGRGKWVVPGLIDAHVHFFQSGGPYTRPDVIDLRKDHPYEQEMANIKARLPQTFARYLRCGITSVADVGGPMWNFDVRDIAARSLAPRVAVAGPLISTVARPQLDLGDPPIVKVAGPDEARALVRRLAERKPDLVKIWYVVQAAADVEAARPIVAATVAESRAHGLRVAVHATELEAARVAVEEGAAVLVHSVWDKPVDEAFVAKLKQQGVVYTPTLFVPDGYRLALEGVWKPTAAESRLGDPGIISALQGLRTLPGFEPHPARAGFEERARNGLDNLKRVSDAGVTIAAGTDAGNIGTIHGPSLFRELALMAGAGLTRAQVLTAATRGGAAVMGYDKELGTLEAGKLADLLVLDADPLADLAALESPRIVVKGGRVLTTEDLNRAAGAER